MDKEKYKEYESLLLERDALLHEAGSYSTAYMKEFGEEIVAVFEKKIECIKKKKSIAFCQMKINRGEKVDSSELENYIKDAMSDYAENLKQLIADNKRAADADACGQADVLKSKRIYRKIAKLIHPDINPTLFENDNIRELWERVRKAYSKNDADELESLEFLICSLLEDMGIDSEMPEIEDIDDKIEDLKNDINEIVTTDPYLYGELLSDAELVEEKHAELAKELEEHTAYSRELDEVLERLLGTGMVISWEMKL